MNRVLIISQEKWELSTEQVMDWVWYFGGSVQRLNGDIFAQLNNKITISISTQNLFEVDGEEVDLSCFDSVWLRRWSEEHYSDRIKESGLCNEFIYDFITNLKSDNLTLRDFVLQSLKRNSSVWLTDIDKFTINKLAALDCAISSAFNIPKTLLTTERKVLIDFYDQCNGKVITKDISAPIAITAFDKAYMIYAEKVSLNEIRALPDIFPISLFQEMIEKEYEVRCFFLNGEIWSMAIFSQADSQTQVDFRRYNTTKPNRNVPYKLPDEVEASIRRFMEKLNYQTGSFDFIKGQDGQYYFLELNPVGQFGMVSYPCNYGIEKQIAKFLIN